jgi:hypothetical protein
MRLGELRNLKKKQITKKFELRTGLDPADSIKSGQHFLPEVLKLGILSSIPDFKR